MGINDIVVLPKFLATAVLAGDNTLKDLSHKINFK